MPAQAKKTKSLRKSTYHHGNLREALISGAIEILEEEGLSALSLRGVARRAGVSQAAPYHHFKNKKGMLAAIAVRGFEEMGRAQQADAKGAEKKGRLGALGRGYVNFGLAHPALLRLMFGPELSSPSEFPELAAVGSESYRQLTEAVSVQMTEGDEDGLSPQIAALAAWALVHGLAMLMIDGRLPTSFSDPKKTDELIEQVTAAFARGL